eukprot:gene11805-14428_t
MVGNHGLAAIKQEIAGAAGLALVDDGQSAPHRQWVDGRKTQVMPGIDKGARRRNDMRRAFDYGCQAIFRKVPDIAVEISFHPAPALIGIEHANRFAEQQLGIGPAGKIGLCPKRRHRHGDARDASLDVALGIDDAAKAAFGEVGSIGIQAAIGKCRHVNSLRLFAALINDQIAELFKIKSTVNCPFDDDIASIAIITDAIDEPERAHGIERACDDRL